MAVSLQDEEARRERRAMRRGLTAGRAARLRRWLLGGAVMLLLALVGLIGYARHRARLGLLNLPRLLGADIRSETDGFTYSQTVKGRTLFTIHAAKAVQHRDGKTTLRNVSVMLYGEPGSNRVDSIRGAEFEYDQPNGVVRAVGETHLDLASPAAGAGGLPNAKRISVTTSGLVLNQKTGVAVTEQRIQFRYGTTEGEAVGATYDAGTGMLQLAHAVHLRSLEGGKMQRVDADAAQMDRVARTAVLQRAVVTEPGETLRAVMLTLQLRPEGVEGGSLQRVDGSGGVVVQTQAGQRLTSATLHADVNATNRPEQAVLRGGVDLAGPEATGHAGEATIAFDATGHASRVRMSGAVHLASAASGTAARDLVAEQMDAVLASDGSGHAVLRDAVATGAARLTVIDAADGPGKLGKTTVVSAATLHAIGASRQGVWELSRLEGEGATKMEEREGSGLRRTSTGDHLLIAIRGGGSPNVLGTLELESVVQEGHVGIVEDQPAQRATAVGGARAAQQTQAFAQRAEYHASTGKVVLTGAPEIRDARLEVVADRITASRETGDAEAEGSVRGTSLTSKAVTSLILPVNDATSDPLHFVADRMTTRRAAQSVTLVGGPGGRARLWNGSAQMEAPVVDVDGVAGTLHGHAAAASTNIGVLAVLPTRSGDLPSTRKAKVTGKPTGRSAEVSEANSNRPLQVACLDLVYTEAREGAPGQARFLGEVRLNDGQSTVFANEATAEMRPALSGGPEQNALGGSVDRVIAEGNVLLEQTGRRATGERLVYTSAGQNVVLTGTAESPPVVRDSVQGTVTGASLVFHAGSNSIEVVGAVSRPVHTITVAPPRGSGASGAGPGRKHPSGSIQPGSTGRRTE